QRFVIAGDHPDAATVGGDNLVWAKMRLEERADGNGITRAACVSVRAWRGETGGCAGWGLNERGAADKKCRPRVLQPVVVPAGDRTERDLTIGRGKRRDGGGGERRWHDGGRLQRGTTRNKRQNCNGGEPEYRSHGLAFPGSADGARHRSRHRVVDDGPEAPQAARRALMPDAGRCEGG